MSLTLKIISFISIFILTSCYIQAQKSPRPPHEVVAELQSKKAQLEKEVATLTRENKALRARIVDYERQIRKLTEQNIALQDELRKRSRNQQERDSLSRVITTLEEERKRYQDSTSIQRIELNRLRQDSIEAKNYYNQFKNNHLFLTDSYVVPYGVPIGPIPFGGKNEGYPLNPDRPTGVFLSMLQHIDSSNSEVMIVVNISGPITQKDDIISNIKAELEGYCKNCRFNFQFDPAGKSSQISFIFQKNTP